MAPRIIYQSPANANMPGAGWTIIQDPTDRRNPNLVRFLRQNGQRKLLDQIAEWNPHAQAWTASRWLPKPPIVPQWLIDKVVAHMSFEARA
jgi:hypothetical protein